jgi:hypothetical protein
VPEDRHKTTSLGVRKAILHCRCNITLVLNARWGVVHKVDGHKSGKLSGLLFDPVGPYEVLLTREDLLAIDGLEIVVESDGIGVGVGVDQIGGDLVRRARLRCSQSDGVNQIPASPIL